MEKSNSICREEGAPSGCGDSGKKPKFIQPRVVVLGRIHHESHIARRKPSCIQREGLSHRCCTHDSIGQRSRHSSLRIDQGVGICRIAADRIGHFDMEGPGIAIIETGIAGVIEFNPGEGCGSSQIN